MLEKNPSLKELCNYVKDGFTEFYKSEPQWIVSAPGRVNVIGEHTDYNDGFVLPMAIERYTVIAANRSKKTNFLNWHCAKTNRTAKIELTKPIKKGKQGNWTNYIAGVFAGYQELGIETGALDVFMYSSVPIGGGLSSSAALEVSTATLIEAVSGKTIDKVKKALLCQKAEHSYAGMPCGIMDQFISALGKKDNLLLIDCRTQKYELVPMNDDAVSVLIFNTNVKHKLVGGEYAQRRKQCEEAAKILGVKALRDANVKQLNEHKNHIDSTVYKRALHVIEENERTLKSVELVKARKWKDVGTLLYSSHNSLKNLFEVSCEELDIVVELAQQIGVDGGVYGCRMTGGGFGGCTVALVKTNSAQDIASKLIDGYTKRTGIEPSVFASRPANGAEVLMQ